MFNIELVVLELCNRYTYGYRPGANTTKPSPVEGNIHQINLFIPRAQKLSTDGTKKQVSLSSEAAEKLLELEQKGFDISLLILDLLKERDEKIKSQKILLANQATQTRSRYIPKATKQLLTQEYGTKCAISTCHKPAEQIHHTQRFSIDKTHNPFYLAPLCKAHHHIAHSVDMKNGQSIRTARFSR